MTHSFGNGLEIAENDVRAAQILVKVNNTLGVPNSRSLRELAEADEVSLDPLVSSVSGPISGPDGAGRPTIIRPASAASTQVDDELLSDEQQLVEFNRTRIDQATTSDQLPPSKTKDETPLNPASKSRVRFRDLGSPESKSPKWYLLSLMNRLGTFAVGIALARLLGPVEFGAYAVATIVLIAILSVNELGVSLAIVRWRDNPREIVPIVATVSVVFSTFLTAVVWALAPLLAAAMGDPTATPVIRVMSICILVNGFASAPAAVLQREFRQRQRLRIDQVNIWLGSLVSLVLVLTGFGAIGLGLGRLAGSGISIFMLFHASRIPFRFSFSRRLFVSLLQFGLPLAGASAVVFVTGYASVIVSGWMLGAQALGFYMLALLVADWPLRFLALPLRVLARREYGRRKHDNSQSSELLLKFLRLVAAVAVPVCFGIAGASAPLIRVLYGSPWAPVAPILLVLAVGALGRIGVELCYDYLVVRGKSTAILVTQIISSLVLVPTLILGAHLGGMVGIAVAQVTVGVAVGMPLYLGFLHNCGVKPWQVLQATALPVAMGLPVGVGAWIAANWIDSATLSCLISGALICAGTAGALMTRRPELRAFRDMQSMAAKDPVPDGADYNGGDPDVLDRGSDRESQESGLRALYWTSSGPGSS